MDWFIARTSPTSLKKARIPLQEFIEFLVLTDAKLEAEGKQELRTYLLIYLSLFFLRKTVKDRTFIILSADGLSILQQFSEDLIFSEKKQKTYEILINNLQQLLMHNPSSSTPTDQNKNSKDQSEADNPTLAEVLAGEGFPSNRY